jgi:hypothetical protein
VAKHQSLRNYPWMLVPTSTGGWAPFNQVTKKYHPDPKYSTLMWDTHYKGKKMVRILNQFDRSSKAKSPDV